MKYSNFTRRGNLLAMAVLGSISFNTDLEAEAGAAASTEAASSKPALPTKFEHSFYFRSVKDTPQNREDIQKLGEIQEIPSDEEGGENLIRRATEKYTFALPEINTGDAKLDVVMLDMIKKEIISAANAYVKKGEVPPADKMQWSAIVEAKYLAITTAASDDDTGSGFNSALLKEVATSFSNFMKAIGRDPDGTAIMSKMITGRFSIITTHKFIKGLPMVMQNIEKWFLEGLNEEQQTMYTDVTQYLLGQAEKAQKPQEVEVGSLFG
jgi:hypothetical protein